MANPLRKTLEYLGLVEEDGEADERLEAQPVASASQPLIPQSSHRATVTPIRRAGGKAAEVLNEIVTVHPKKYADVQNIASSFREGIPVIINLSQMSEPDARRLVDFASGLAEGLYGKIERVTPKVFLLSPSHVLVSSEDSPAEESDKASGFFN